MFKDLSVLETDFAERMLADCSRSKGIVLPAGFKVTNGILPIQKALFGAKILLLLKTTDCICDWEWCGDNCNKYIVEIAKEKDVIMYSTRYVNPFERADNLDEVLILNNNKKCYNGTEYVMMVAREDLMEY